MSQDPKDHKVQSNSTCDHHRGQKTTDTLHYYEAPGPSPGRAGLARLECDAYRH